MKDGEENEAGGEEAGDADGDGRPVSHEVFGGGVVLSPENNGDDEAGRDHSVGRLLLHGADLEASGAWCQSGREMSASISKDGERKFLQFRRGVFECPAYDETARADFL